MRAAADDGVTNYKFAILRETVFNLVRNQELCHGVGEDGLCLRLPAGTSLSAAEHGGLTAWGGSHSTAFLSSGQELDLGHEVGADRLCLRLPTVVMHVIKDGSPLAHWADPSGILLDADSEIVVVVSPPPQSPCSKAQSK